MPIKGLTDTQTVAFMEIGRLRKGAPKGKGLKDLTYFRPDFRPDQKQAEADFLEAYGEQANNIRIRLPFPDISQSWDAFYMVYNTTGLLGKADGEKWIYLRDNKTGEILVRDGVPHKKFDPYIPVYAYYSQTKKMDIPVYARPEGRLRFVIPELRRAAFVTLITHSIYDVAKISQQLYAIQVWALIFHKKLSDIMLILSRRPEEVSVTIDGKKAREVKNLVNIEVDPVWAAAALELQERLLPGYDIELPTLPAGVLASDDDEEPEETIAQLQEDTKPIAGLATPEATGAPELELNSDDLNQLNNGRPQRPYNPNYLVKRLAEVEEAVRNGLSSKKKVTLKPDTKEIILESLKGVLESMGNDAGPDDVSEFVFGKPLALLSDTQYAALDGWLDPQLVEGAWTVEGNTANELGQVYQEIAKARAAQARSPQV